MDFIGLRRAIEAARAQGKSSLPFESRFGMSVTVQLDETRKGRDRRYKRDYMVLTEGWGERRPTWAEIIQRASEVVDVRERGPFQAVVVGLWAGEDLDGLIRKHAPLRRSEDWWRLFFVVQLVALQEELNYGSSNGWWTSFHLLRCIWRGADSQSVQRAATAMRNDRRPLGVQDCADCLQCDMQDRPWQETNPRLRNYYASANGWVKDRFLREPLPGCG